MKLVIRGKENRRIVDLPELMVFQRTPSSGVYLKTTTGSVNLKSGQHDFDSHYGKDRVQVVHGVLTVEEK